MREKNRRMTGNPISYKDAGVNIDAAEAALEDARSKIRATFTEGVVGDVGAFAGLFRPDFSGMQDPLIAGSADGVGTKLLVALAAGRHDSIGRDLVNHCVDDILVQGARPLFFFDYIGTGRLDPVVFDQVLDGLAEACKENGCALLGGETAEMPGVYPGDEYDLVGFIVGMVDRESILDGTKVSVGDRLLALPSTGLHTNGYSLARRIVFERLALGVDDEMPGTGRTVADALLEPHRSYLDAVSPLLADPGLHAMAHITGGGLPGNLVRPLPEGLGARVDRSTWTVPGLFRTLVDGGQVPDEDAWRTFNMGVGLVLIVAEDAADRIADALSASGEEPWDLGTVEAGKGLSWA